MCRSTCVDPHLSRPCGSGACVLLRESACGQCVRDGNMREHGSCRDRVPCQQHCTRVVVRMQIMVAATDGVGWSGGQVQLASESVEGGAPEERRDHLRLGMPAPVRLSLPFADLRAARSCSSLCAAKESQPETLAGTAVAMSVGASVSWR
eukprot:256725-Rhodomonas_salina.1